MLEYGTWSNTPIYRLDGKEYTWWAGHKVLSIMSIKSRWIKIKTAKADDEQTHDFITYIFRADSIKVDVEPF
jgi:hypothetical protein